MRTLLAVTAAVSLLSAASAGDIAVLSDGRRVTGELAAGPDGRLRFQPVGNAAALPLDQVEQVRFPESSPPLRFPLLHQVVLHDGQRLTGELLGMDGQSVRLRPGWSEPRTFPRTAVAAVLQPPGLLTVAVEDFENDLRAWTLTGQPVRDDRKQTSGRHGLCLTSAGQSATYALASPLEAGAVGVNFLDTAVSREVRGRVELVFDTPAGPRELRVTVIDGDTKGPGVEMANRIRWKYRATFTGGWLRLRVNFAPGSVQVLVDDHALWTDRRQGPGGPLRQVRLVRNGGKGNDDPIWFDDLSVARRVEAIPHPEGDPSQDEVWLEPGDQLFGRIAKADRRTVELHGRFGQRSLSWTEVRGIRLRKEKLSPPAVGGERVRLGLNSLDHGEPDRLDGVVQALDRKRLVLRHALLGEVIVPREWCHRMERWPK